MNGLRPIHSPFALEIARSVALRRMNSICEIYAPGARGRQKLGTPDPGDKILGRSRCAVSQAVKPNERGSDDDAAQSSTEYEFSFPRGIRLEPSFRLAVPLRPELWSKETAVALGKVVAPSRWVSGETPFFRCIIAGNTAAIEPIWPQQPGQKIGDGTCLWQLAGFANLYEVIAVNKRETQNVETLVRVKELES